MSKWRENLARIAAGIGLVGMTWGCKNPAPLQFLGIREGGLELAGLDSATLRLELKCYNPNSLGVTVKEGFMDVFATSTLLGRMLQDSPVHVPSRDTFYFPMHLALSLQTLIRYGSGLHLGDSILLQGTGSCRIGKWGIYFIYPLRLVQKVRLNLF